MSDVPRETRERIDLFGRLLVQENDRQNLISRNSVDTLWLRHLDDSLQLLDFGPQDANWLDIGSGPGLPGLVLAIAGVRAITLVEPRRLRTEFLSHCVAELGLSNVTVITGKVEAIEGRFDVITARAVAPLERLFAMAGRLMRPGGRWVLPKGRSAAKELEAARRTWQGDFQLLASRTDPNSRIIVAERVQRRAGRG